MGDEAGRLLFVYGSLLPGEAAGSLLEHATPAGPARTRRGYELLDLGAYPGLRQGGGGSVLGELFLVDDATLATLDEYEGTPDLFCRAVVMLSDGRAALAYFYVADVVGRATTIASGDWRRRRPR